MQGLIRFIAPIAMETFLLISLICFAQVSRLSIISPNDLVCVTFSMLLLSILIRGSGFPSASSFCRDPINMNSVFAMFKLNLFALSQQLRLFSSAFTEVSRSVWFVAETLMCVSSANIFADAMLRLFGKSLMYIKKSKGPIILPWGTPQLSSFAFERLPLTLHFWLRWLR